MDDFAEHQKFISSLYTNSSAVCNAKPIRVSHKQFVTYFVCVEPVKNRQAFYVSKQRFMDGKVDEVYRRFYKRGDKFRAATAALSYL